MFSLLQTLNRSFCLLFLMPGSKCYAPSHFISMLCSVFGLFLITIEWLLFMHFDNWMKLFFAVLCNEKKKFLHQHSAQTISTLNYGPCTKSVWDIGYRRNVFVPNQSPLLWNIKYMHEYTNIPSRAYSEAIVNVRCFHMY